MEIIKLRDRVELVQMTKWINRRLVSEIRAFKRPKVEETVKRGGILRETKKELGIGRDRIYALKDVNGNITNNMDDIVSIADTFYTELYDSNVRPEKHSL